jgi:hypothetical protein
MIQKEVSAKVPAKDGKPEMSATVLVNYTEDLEEAKQMFGENAILTNAFANWRVTLQANIRNKLAAGKTPEQIQAELADAKMGVAAIGSKVDPQQAFLMKFKNATPEEQSKMLEMLRSAAQ